jgi:hypothetical protein
MYDVKPSSVRINSTEVIGKHGLWKVVKVSADVGTLYALKYESKFDSSLNQVTRLFSDLDDVKLIADDMEKDMCVSGKDVTILSENDMCGSKVGPFQLTRVETDQGTFYRGVKNEIVRKEYTFLYRSADRAKRGIAYLLKFGDYDCATEDNENVGPAAEQVNNQSLEFTPNNWKGRW